MRPDLLARAIAADRAAGLLPIAVVATVGSTSSTSIDPVDAIAAICGRERVWLHVDAAYAGVAAMVPGYEWILRGAERADSLVVNPHKWLFTPFDLSVLYCRRMDVLRQAFALTPEYLKTSEGESGVRNLMDTGIQLGRRFRALKLWFLIREQGIAKLQARLRRDLANARWLADQVRAAAGWRLVAPVALQTLCVRHEPAGLDGDELDRHTQAWVARVNRSGAAYLTPAILDGRWMARVSIGVESTERRHVEALWRTLRAEAEAAT
jgi:aromatic-L-amino-acid decarboxylase